jgi:hypothetical protein
VVRFFVIAFRVLLVLLALRLLGRAVAAVWRPRPAPGADPRPSGELVRDRVCNTFLPRERAIRALVGGREEHFCSAACRERALAAHARAS